MPDVLGTQRGLIHHLCLERNQDLVPNRGIKIRDHQTLYSDNAEIASILYK